MRPVWPMLSRIYGYKVNSAVRRWQSFWNDSPSPKLFHTSSWQGLLQFKNNTSHLLMRYKVFFKHLKEKREKQEKRAGICFHLLTNTFVGQGLQRRLPSIFCLLVTVVLGRILKDILNRSVGRPFDSNISVKFTCRKYHIRLSPSRSFFESFLWKGNHEP